MEVEQFHFKLIATDIQQRALTVGFAQRDTDPHSSFPHSFTLIQANAARSFSFHRPPTAGTATAGGTTAQPLSAPELVPKAHLEATRLARAGVGERRHLPAPTVGAHRRLLLPLLPPQDRLSVFPSGPDRSQAGFASNEPLVQAVRIRALEAHVDLRSRHKKTAHDLFVCM